MSMGIIKNGEYSKVAGLGGGSIGRHYNYTE